MMSEARQPRFGIIEPGLVREPLRETFGDYPSMLKTLLSEHFTGNQFDTFSIVNGEALPEPTAYDGFVVMGSAHGVKDGLPWFDALCEWIGNVVDQRVPLVGICFGHQAIAQALGGDVGRSSSGWCVGLQRYSVAGQSDGQSALIAHAFHQDQVVESPPGADTVMSTPLCPHAGFLIPGRPVFTMQFHPEFSTPYAKALLELTAGNAVDQRSAKGGIESLSQTAHTQAFAEAIVVALRNGDRNAVLQALASCQRTGRSAQW